MAFCFTQEQIIGQYRNDRALCGEKIRNRRICPSGKSDGRCNARHPYLVH
jgi:hypothetical protein